MADMGHGGMGHDMSAMDATAVATPQPADPHAGHAVLPAPAPPPIRTPGTTMPATGGTHGDASGERAGNPLVDMQTMSAGVRSSTIPASACATTAGAS